ncbi:MAG: glycosyltransferase family 2 protein [Helicobacteraceae bacterium]|nr:glycosyltransferase family 2 protein [Helicobacteraceae bacterium]
MESKAESLSIIVPCYNEEENIQKFYETLINQNDDIKKLDYEIIFVDDGSKDSSILEVKKLQKIDSKVRLIKFSRNFGKESAMLAGLKASKKNLVTIMDCDLQDPPSLLFEMLKIYEENNGKIKMIIAKRKNRAGESKIRAYLSNLFYRLNNAISKVRLVSGVRDFRLMSREVVESIIQMNEYHRFSKAIFEFVGYEKRYLEYEYISRTQGVSKWSFMNLFSYGIEGIISFSTAPLKIITIIGFLIFLISSIYGFYIIISTLIFGNPVKGYPSTIVLISFFGGLQIIMLGIIGEYIARIYEQGKNRPHYFIEYED